MRMRRSGAPRGAPLRMMACVQRQVSATHDAFSSATNDMTAGAGSGEASGAGVTADTVGAGGGGATFPVTDARPSMRRAAVHAAEVVGACTRVTMATITSRSRIASSPSASALTTPACPCDARSCC